MMGIKSFEFNPFAENTYILFDETAACVIVDPGCSTKAEFELLCDYIEEKQLQPTLLLNTHCHIDHILGNYDVREHFRIPLLIHKMEEPVLRSGKVFSQAYGIPNYQETQPDDFLSEHSPVKFGDQELEVLFVPGHSPGHVAFYHRTEHVLMGGDVLFRNSIGRTDLPGGNHDQLINSIHTKLFSLPDDTVVYPGHGPETTIGYERKTNPFCAIPD